MLPVFCWAAELANAASSEELPSRFAALTPCRDAPQAGRVKDAGTVARAVRCGSA